MNMQALRHFLLAIQFFTRIPVTGRLAQWVGFSPAMLRASAAHFPAVGLVVGMVAAGVYATLAVVLPATAWTAAVAAVLSTVASVLLTGGFHEDGLSDLSDGLGGSQERERALEIMKDSRVGAFGAMALVLALLSKVGLLALLGNLSLPLVVVALLGGHVVSRTWPLFTIAALPHVGDSAHSKAKPLADQLSRQALLVGLAWCVATLLGLVMIGPVLIGPALSGQALLGPALPWPALAMPMAAGVAAAGLGWAVVHWRLRTRLAGFTGDGLGAAQQVAEIAFYLGLALAWPH